MESNIILYDDVEWYYEYALNNYLKLNKKEIGNLTYNDKKYIYEWAGNHIAFFITWIVKRNYQSDFFPSFAVEALRTEKITGIEFLHDYCDGKIVSDMIIDGIIPFMNKFYNKNYLKKHYAHWVMTVLNDLPLEFEWNWNDCHKYEKYLTRRYNSHVRSVKKLEEYLKSKNNS